MARVVVLGTGTGGGKTYVSTTFVRELARAGAASVLGLKPVESGVSDDPAGTDAQLLADASFHVKPPTPLRRHSFREPVSPHLAARAAGTTIKVADLVEWVVTNEDDCPLPYVTTLISQYSRWSVIETAGGAFSPLSDTTTCADLAEALEPCLWMLVGRDALGTLHDVAATTRALKRVPDVVVLSAPEAPDASTGTNANEMLRLGLAARVIELSRGGSRPLANLATRWMTKHSRDDSPPTKS